MPDRRPPASSPLLRTVAAVAVVAAVLAPPGRATAPDTAVATYAARPRPTLVDPFSTFGLSWAAGTGHERTVEVRFLHADGWGPWITLVGSADEGPDRASPERGARVATPPVWAGGARGYELRGDVAGARVHLVRPNRPAAAVLPAAPTADANVPRPAILPRDSWSAREPVDPPSTGGDVRMAFVHHSAGSSTYTAEQVPEVIRGIQAFHMDVNGWDDIGYNFVVDRFGRVWEGRSGGSDEPVVGAHTEGFNSSSTGVVVLGTYGDAPPSRAALDALAGLLSWKLPAHGVDPAGKATVVSRGNERHPQGAEVTFDAVAGHREAKATSCPGAALHARLGWLRDEASAGAGAVAAHPADWRHGLFVAAGHLDLDGVPEVVTGADRGAAPEVRTFDADGTLRSSTVVYPPGFRGGVRVAAGDLDGVGADEIVTGAGPGGGPDVRVLHEGAVPTVSFLAYTPGFAGGVYVAVGDVDPSPGEEIVTGAGAGGGPHVRVFRFDGRPLWGFMAYDPAFGGGVRVATADVDGDGRDEVVTAPGPGGGPHVRVFSTGGRAVDGWMAYGPAFAGGVYVASAHDATTGVDLVVTGAGEGGGPHVRFFGGRGAVAGSFFSGRPSSTHGVRVGGGTFVPGDDGLAVLAGGPGASALVKLARRDGRLVFPG